MRGTELPVLIVCRDRLGCLVDLVAWLEGAGHDHLVLVDNASTYPPLLDWMAGCGHRVVHLTENRSHLAPFTEGLVPTDRPFVVTDCDVVPAPPCPADAVDHLLDVLLSHDVAKVGLGLRLDDLPDTAMARAARCYERRFWAAPLRPGVFDAPVDTTFALYRPGLPFAVEGVRTGPPYVARHTTWYLDPDDLPPDERWYAAHRASRTEWSGRY